MMPSPATAFFYIYSLTGKTRSRPANRHLALFLALLAGVINASGFLAVEQYTGHMSGVVAQLADSLVGGQLDLALSGLCALLSFGAGAAASTVLIISSTQKRLESLYAIPLLLEACFLGLLGLMGDSLQSYEGIFILGTISLLCFVMGLQNATITTMSHAEIRTTHVTGLVTDLGMELGKGLFAKIIQPSIRIAHPPHIQFSEPNPQKLSLLLSLLGMFFLGGALGTFNFIYAGFHSIVAFAVTLGLLAGLPILADLGWLKIPVLEVRNMQK